VGLLGDIAVKFRSGVLAPEVEQMFTATRERVSRRMSPRQLRAESLVGGAFVAAAALFAILAPGGHIPPGTAVALVVALAILARVEFPVGAGWAVPTQLVFVPMLFLLPAYSVPFLVAAAMLLSRVPDFASRRWHPQRALLAVSDAWFSLGPAIVFAVASIHRVHWADWWIWLLALLAQFAVDFAASAAREWLHYLKPPELQLRELGIVWLVDCSCAPVGLIAAMASEMGRFTFLLVLPLVAVMAAFAQERRFRIEQAIDLSRAYQGTALLLGDVIEDDDNYTGEHSRGVVALAVEISDELGLDARRRRLVEFGALLHDVGKVRVPKEILHKPGPLDDDERAVMRMHTIEGQRMLDRVGGDLEDVGVVVRASHEHWDGSGYPDGLAGEAIPLEARIVTCADAFSAMTTDRPYRGAMTLERAIGELSANAGTQFDPTVVEALLRVLARHAGEEHGAAAAAAIAAAAAVPMRS
jgi:putative nucleotidyltransferase with HDIG domain